MNEPLVWQEATLVTLSHDNDYGIIRDGAMVIENGIIAWVGKTRDVPLQYHHGKRISVQGALVTPGLIDCHTHIVFGGHRANEWVKRLSGETYESIARAGGGIQATVRATEVATEATLLRDALKRVREMLSGGVTTIEIKSGYGLSLETERKMLRVIQAIKNTSPLDVYSTFLGAHVCPPTAASAQSYIDHVIEVMLPALLQEGLVDAVDGYCDTVGFTEASLQKLFQFAKSKKLAIKIHADQLSAGRGVYLIEEYEGISADHLEYTDEAGVQALQRAGAVAVLLPGAHYFLQQDKKPPIALLRHYGVPMAVATDCNPGTSPTMSLLLMMNMSCVQYGLTPLESLQAVTCWAAKALGILSQKGSLVVGKVADFVIWDADDPIELSYYFGHNPCSQVIKNGKIVYEKPS